MYSEFIHLAKVSEIEKLKNTHGFGCQHLVQVLEILSLVYAITWVNLIWFEKIFYMWIAIIIILDEFLYGNISKMGLGENFSFLLKNHQFWELSLVYAITWVNVIWFEKFFAFGSELSFSWMNSYIEIFQELVLGKILVFFSSHGQRPGWAFAITWRPSSVLRRKLFIQSSSPLKLLDKF